MTTPCETENPSLKAVHGLYEISLDCNTLSEQLTKSLELLLGLPWLTTRHSGCVYLTQGGTRTLSLAAALGVDASLHTQCDRLTYDKCASGRAAKTGEIAFVDSTSSFEGCPGHCPSYHHAIPLKHENRVLGVLTISISESKELDPHQQKFLLTAGNILGKLILRHEKEAHSRQLASFAHENPKPVLECNLDGEPLYENPALKKMLWQHAIDLEEALPPLHTEIIKISVENNSNNTSERDVNDRVFSWLYHPLPQAGRVHIYGSDITERRSAERQLVRNAMHDTLTGLPNRLLLTDRISGALGMLRRRNDYNFALLLLDLDHFKTITESLGYSVGDKVLKKISERIVRVAGSEDTVGRLGGDEFAILLEDVQNANTAVSLAKAIQDKVQMPMDLGNRRISVSASISIVMGGTKYDRPEEVIRDAGTAIHRAKAQGLGRCILFDEEMHESAMSRLQTQSELRDALAQGHITAFYQPIFSLKDLRLRGFEALARWEHPVRGIVSPGEFIPVAEETGLIIPLGEHILKLACEQLKAWRLERLPLAWVSVNLSAHQFKLPDLVPRISRLLQSSGANPHRLMLEITEGTAAESPERAVRMMKELKERGIRIALDDFGTGYSSMSYLKRFPIDALKIDRSFVQDLPDSQDDAAIASTVIAMSQALGLKVVAEGVENERQALFLRSLGCDEVQGFLYARPMRASEATATLKESGGRYVP